MEKELTILYMEMIRINPQNTMELQKKSCSMGSCWSRRFSDDNIGNFLELEYDPEHFILEAKTDKGTFYSTNGGRNWRKIEEDEEEEY